MSIEQPRFMLAMILRDIRKSGDNPNLGPLNEFIDRVSAHIGLREAESVPEDHIDRIAHQREILQFQIARGSALSERYRLTQKASETPGPEKVTVESPRKKKMFNSA